MPMLMQPLQMFVVDHPFLYSIARLNGRDADRSFMSLFNGRVVEPLIDLPSELRA